MSRGAHDDLYHSAFWHRRRKLQLRHEPLCRRCAAAGKVVAARVADHITPHDGGNGFYIGELQSLCFNCHNRGKRLVDLKGFSSSCGEDGWPTDPAHPTNVRAAKTGGN